MPGLSVFLVDEQGHSIGNTTTNESGDYIFSNEETSSPDVIVEVPNTVINNIAWESSDDSLCVINYLDTNNSPICYNTYMGDEGLVYCVWGVIEDPVNHYPINGTVNIIGDNGTISVNTTNADRYEKSYINGYLSFYRDCGQDLNLPNVSLNITNDSDVPVFLVPVSPGNYRVYAVYSDINGTETSTAINVSVKDNTIIEPTILIVNQQGTLESTIIPPTVSDMPTIAVSPSPTTVPSPIPSPGFTFESIAILCGLLLTTSLIKTILVKRGK